MSYAPRCVVAVRGGAPSARHPVGRTGADASAVCDVCRTSRLAPDHDPAGTPVGHDAYRRAAGDVGSSPFHGEAVCRVVERIRSSHRGAAVPTLAGPKTATTTAYLHGRGNSSFDGRGDPTAIPHRLARPRYTTLIGLLAATGLRPGEALILDRSDVDLDAGILSIRESKFGNSRLVPIVPSTRDVLQQYATRRDALCLKPSSQAFLLSERGQRVQGSGRSGHVCQADV